MAMECNIENIMRSTVGETSSKVRASYKKTVLIRQYETEVIELETELNVERKLSGAERMLISAILQAQLEFMAYTQLGVKGLITQTELDNRKKELETSVALIKAKGEKVLGADLDKYLTFNME